MPASTKIPKVSSIGLSEQLSKEIPDPGMFEDIPKLKRIAGDSAGP
jgi:hypothetical protein